MATKSVKQSGKNIPVTIIGTKNKELPKYKGLKVVDIGDDKIKRIYTRLRQYRKTAERIFVVIEEKQSLGGEIRILHNMTNGDAFWYIEKFKSKIMRRALNEDEYS